MRTVESRPPEDDRAFFSLLEEDEPAAGERLAARVLRVEGDLLTIELDLPWTGGNLPGDGSPLEALIRDRLGERMIAARVVGDRSTAPGHYPGGVTVRLCLRLTEPVPERLPFTILGIEDWRIVVGDPNLEASR